MPVEQTFRRESHPLPMEFRVALDLVFERRADRHGVMGLRTVGDDSLASALALYGSIDDDSQQLVLFAVSAAEARVAIANELPDSVTTLGAGKLSRVLRTMRNQAIELPSPLSEAGWRRLGYERSASIGVQGLASLGWAAADQALRRLNRPHVADRCRVAMLRTLVASRLLSRFSTVLVQEYRRVA